MCHKDVKHKDVGHKGGGLDYNLNWLLHNSSRFVISELVK